MIHTMLDLETVGTKPGCPVIQIGAVKFDATAILDRFSVAIGLTSNEANGLRMAASTVEWWLDPDRDEARKVWMDMPKVTLFEACAGFVEWVEETPAEGQGMVWGNGASFDVPILQTAVAAVQLDWPFSYRQEACFRTMKTLVPDVAAPELSYLVAHVAVDDAEWQAVHLQMICAQIGVRL